MSAARVTERARSGMLQADYTRKTQALAEERRRLDARFAELSDDADDLFDALQACVALLRRSGVTDEALTKAEFLVDDLTR